MTKRPPTAPTEARVIGINLLPLRFDGGGARYAFEGIFAAMLELAPARQFLLFASPPALAVSRALVERLGCAARAELITVRHPEDIWAHADRLDAYWAPLNNYTPRLLHKPGVAFVLDIQDQVFPEYFSQDDREARDEVYRDICRSATLTATITEYSRQLILTHFQTPPDRLRVVHLAAQTLEPKAAVPALDPWCQGRPYLFYPANFYPHKNHRLLLDLADATSGQTDGGERLVFLGKPWQGHPGATEEISRRGLEKQILALGDASSGQLSLLYRDAEAVVIASKFEGFCMPALEAAAAGTPVVCAELPAVRELLGDAALYFPPDDLAALRTALTRLRTEPGLRERLVAGGKQRAALFTWCRSAATTLALLDEAVERHHRPPADPLPGITLAVRLRRNVPQALRTLQSLREAPYPRLRVVVFAPPGALAPEVLAELAALPQAETRAATSALPLPAGELLALAETHGHDLAGEICEGDLLLPGALTALAQTWQEAGPRPAVLLGETVMEDERGRLPPRVSYLRFRPYRLIEFSGQLFPAALWLSVAGARRDGLAGKLAAQPAKGWQWEALQLAQTAGSLLAVRRTFAFCRPCNQARSSLWHRAAASLGAPFTLDDVPPPSRLAWHVGKTIQKLVRLRARGFRRRRHP